MREPIGRRRWSIAGGRMPLGTTGPEPAMTSRDELRFLNTGPAEVRIEITVVYSDREPIGPYVISVSGNRLRRIRVNDLIDPLPVPLETDYALTIETSAPIVVQFTSADTRSADHALMGTIAFPRE